MATALPSRTTGNLDAGMWALIMLLGAVPKLLAWDNEAGIGQHQRLTVGARSFARRAGHPDLAGAGAGSGNQRRGGAGEWLPADLVPPVRKFTDPMALTANSSLAVRANNRLVGPSGHSPAMLVAVDRAAMASLPRWHRRSAATTRPDRV